MTGLNSPRANATYIYDYAGRRVIKSVVETDCIRLPDNCIRPPETTVYISKEYELRDGKFIKYIFAGDRRIAKVEPVDTTNQESNQILWRIGVGPSYILINR